MNHKRLIRCQRGFVLEALATLLLGWCAAVPSLPLLAQGPLGPTQPPVIADPTNSPPPYDLTQGLAPVSGVPTRYSAKLLEQGSGGLPVVPAVQPREFGKIEARRDGVSAPTSSLLEPLSTLDAQIQLVVGQGRLLTLKKPISTVRQSGVVAVGDPSIVDFQLLPNPMMLRLIGKRSGVTDLTILTSDGDAFSFEVQVGYDLETVRIQLLRMFPEAAIELHQLRQHVVLEGQARSLPQIAQIEQTLKAFLSSEQSTQIEGGGDWGGGGPAAEGEETSEPPATDGEAVDGDARAGQPNPENRDEKSTNSRDAQSPASRQDEGSGGKEGIGSQIINLMRVPGLQQVTLQVRIAELDRTGLREIGADFLYASPNGTIIGTQIGGAAVTANGAGGPGGMIGTAENNLGANTTVFGIFPSMDLNIFIRALRQNSLLSVLAEPNLVAMSGHEASFLAGGQFPIPVANGALAQPGIQFKDFGVQLRFVPYILDDDRIRLEVAPEVSTIDNALGTVLVAGGNPVPGINTRRVTTTVEMRQGETLALAGLLQITLDAQTARVPGLGDLPYLGPFFSNTSHRRIEKELLVLVTPFLVAPAPPGETFALPGEEIEEPTDYEFYLLNRIEGRTGANHRSTTNWDDPLGIIEKMEFEQQCLHGPVGLSR
jgi:pilus assembly protein CpaC